MYYINSTPAENGNYGNPRSNGSGLALPDSLIDSYIATMGFAMLTVEDGTVTAVEVNAEALEAYTADHHTVAETPSQQRENAYNTDKLIPWNDDTLTVTEAAKLWSYYAAEGDTDTAAELTALIAEAKAEIRQRYPEVTDP